MRYALFSLGVLACAVITSGQTASPQVPGNVTAPNKTKRVYTNDDLQNLSAPVNVVGPGKPSPAVVPKASQASDGSSGTSQALLPSPQGAMRRREEFCASDTFAAGIAIMARNAGLSFDAKYWATKLFGGVCLARVDMNTAASGISGMYVLDDGSKLRLRADVVRPIPGPELVVSSVKNDQPFLVSYRDRGWLVVGAGGVERVGSNGAGGPGQHVDYIIGDITLRDPITGEQARVDLKQGTGDVAGSLVVRATK